MLRIRILKGDDHPEPADWAAISSQHRQQP